jgi:hypothetical protein
VSKWSVRIGYVLIISGVLLLTPLSELMPVDFLAERTLLEAGESSEYRRVVAMSEARSFVPIVAAIIFGMVFVGFGKFLDRLNSGGFEE